MTKQEYATHVRPGLVLFFDYIRKPDPEGACEALYTTLALIWDQFGMDVAQEVCDCFIDSSMKYIHKHDIQLKTLTDELTVKELKQIRFNYYYLAALSMFIAKHGNITH